MKKARIANRTAIIPTACLRALAALTIAWALFVTAGYAQASKPGVKVSRINTDHYPTIQCSVSAIDDTGKSLVGLTADSFSILENDKPVTNVTLQSILPGKERIAVILVLDRSGSMQGAPITAAKKAAVDFVRRMSEKDVLSVVSFASRVDPSADLTVDRNKVLQAIETIHPRGETAFYDAIQQAVKRLAGYKADRKAVVALTDGQDNASSATAEGCATAAADAGVPVYCIGLGRSLNSNALQLLAKKSGGSCFLTTSPETLTDTYRKIAQQIQNQYELTYTSPSPATTASWRTVKISVHDKGGESSDLRQYLVPIRNASGQVEQNNSSRGLMGVVIIGFLVIDGLLVLFVIRRKSHAKQVGK